VNLVLRYLKPYLSLMTFGFTIKVLATFAELGLPKILSYILKVVVPRASALLIIKWGLLMVLCSVLAFVGNVIANRMAARVSKEAIYLIRRDLFSKMMSLSCRRTDDFTIPSLEGRITTDTYNVQNLIGQMQRLGVRAPILLIGGLVFTASIDPVLTLVMCALLPVITVTVIIVSKKGIPLFRDTQKKVDGMVRVVREDVQGIRVIKALSKTDYEKRRYDAVNANLVRAEQKAGITMAITNPTINLFLNIGLVLVIFVGAIRTDKGLSGAADIIAFTQYLTLISNAVISITRIFTTYTKGIASADRIGEVLDSPDDIITHGKDEYPDIRTSAHVVFKGVSFSYNNLKNNLENISFEIRKGGSLGIIGATGSGKTTIASLLMRFYDADRGGVYINGEDIRTIPRERLHGMFGIAMQNDFIAADTVEENISFGRDINTPELEEAAKTAQAADFIDEFPSRYQHRLQIRGNNISGGQKQRLFISRALAGKPEILILDDSSSALDYKTDANLRRSLRGIPGGVTLIVIAQRISSVMSCDRIIVLDEGKIIGYGTHEELCGASEVYRQISRSQMGGAFVE